jgi:Skp family chaperone for outer membrane proteins
MEEKDLLKIKQKLDTAKDEVNKLKGRLEIIKETLETQWDCATVEDAEAKLQDLQKRRLKLQDKIDEELQQLEEQYGFTDD